MNIATIINYCSNEKAFLEKVISGVNSFSKSIFVVVCDHFFNGEKEDIAQIKKDAQRLAMAQFIVYPYEKRLEHTKIFKRIGQANFWHSFSRYLGFSKLTDAVDYVLFLDADEVVDGDAFNRWLLTDEYKQFDVMKLANYWYFLFEHLRAKVFEDSAVLIKKNRITANLLLTKEERNTLYDVLNGPKKRMVLGVDSKPMIHHYSWVRSQAQMLKKVMSWGHKNDKDWTKLVTEAFEKKDLKKDFVHGYELEKIDKIFSNPPLFNPNHVNNYYQVSAEEVIELLEKKTQRLFRLFNFFSKDKIIAEKKSSF